MKLDNHCKECIKELGKPFKEVHQWLDAFAGTKEFGMRHRKKRHHQNGLVQIQELFGEEAVYAGQLHIISDLKEEGWNKEKDHFPLNEIEYVKMGLF
jgi:hypothetical protein